MNKLPVNAVVIFCSSLLISGVSVAQDAVEAEENVAIEELIITGSRIFGQGATSSPLVQITSEDFYSNPAITISEFMRENVTANAVVDLDEDEAQLRQQAVTGNRTAGVSLWNLGEENTLTLLNGSRVVNYAAPNQDGWYTSDINSLIPGIALSRADVILDGGGAIYGTDAVAGVVNLIPRYSHEGLEIRMQTDFYPDSPSDFANQNIEALFGTSFGDGRGNWIIAATYRDQTALETAEIGTNYADEPYFEYDPNAADALTGDAFTDFFSNDGGAYEYEQVLAGAPPAMMGMGGGGAPAPTPVALVDPYCGTDIAGVDYIHEGIVVPVGIYEDPDDADELIGTCAGYGVPDLRGRGDSERWSIFNAIRYEFTDSIAGRLDIGYSSRKNFQIENFDFNNGRNTNGSVNVNNVLSGDHPAVLYYQGLDPVQYPLAAAWAGADLSAGVDQGTQAGMPPGFVGLGLQESTSMNISGGFDIELDGGMFLKLGANYGVSDVNQGDYDVIIERYDNAVMGLGGAGCDAATGTPGVGDCQWFNPTLSSLDPDQPSLHNDPALLDYIEPDDAITRISSLEMSSLNADLSFSPGLELPGGEVAMVVGVEHRLEEANVTYGEYTLAGGIGSQLDGQIPYGGDVTTNSIYFEAALPVTDTVSFNVAGRYDKYSNLEDASTNPKIGVTWEVSDTVRLRGSYGTSFRAPTIAQIVGFNTRGTLSELIGGGMMAAMSPVTYFYQPDPELAPQSATHYSVGIDADLVEDFGNLDSLSFSANYVNIEFVDRINRSTAVDRSGLDAGLATCALVGERPAGMGTELFIEGAYLTEDEDLDGIPDGNFPCFIGDDGDANGGIVGDNILVFDDVTGLAVLFSNLAVTSMEGINYTVRSNWSTPVGQLSATLNATQTLAYTAQDNVREPVQSFVGVTGLGGSAVANVREWRGTIPLNMRWSNDFFPIFDNHSTSLTYRWDTELLTGGGDLSTGGNGAIDFRHTFGFADDYSVALTVRNMLGFERADVTPSIGSGDLAYALQFTYAPRAGGGMGR